MSAKLVQITDSVPEGVVPEPEPPKFVIGGTELRTPRPSSDGRPHKLLISLPYSYHERPYFRYPVLYLCDGYWDFQLLTGMYGGLLWDEAIEEFIMVGLAYGSGYATDPGIAERSKDYVPDRSDTLHSGDSQSARYLAYLHSEVFRFVDTHYRTRREHRVIAGCSTGGTFSLYAVLNSPTSFSAAIAVSPNLSVSDSVIHRFEAEYFETHRVPATSWFGRARCALPLRLFMAVGADDHPQLVTDARRFSRHLSRRNYQGFNHRLWISREEKHAGMKIEGYSRGLRYAFNPQTCEK